MFVQERIRRSRALKARSLGIFEESRRTQMCHKVICWSMSIFLAIVNHSMVYAQAIQDDQAAQQRLEQELERLEEIAGLLADVRRQVDHSQFDLEVVLDELNFDAEEITKFVRNDIYFEQYKGALRGAQGTLMSRAGNSLDQSLLLSTLLRDAGYDATINRGTLSEISAKFLLEELTAPRRLRAPGADFEGIKAAIRKFGESAGMDKGSLESLLNQLAAATSLTISEEYSKAESDAQFLLAKLEAEGVGLGDPGGL
ncbi:MAG: hypothetical protein R3245_08705, partial [Kiloniellales bacterium]|nr:hypothetical protein [Kiloniellales bacterium]